MSLVVKWGRAMNVAGPTWRRGGFPCCDGGEGRAVWLLRI